MRYLTSFVAVLILSIPMNLYSQENEPFALDDLIPGGKSFAKYSQYRAEVPRALQWMGDNLTYIKGDTLYSVATKDIIKTTVKDINIALGFDGIASLNNITKRCDANRLLVYANDKKTYLINLLTKKIEAKYNLPKGADNTDYSLANKSFAYTKNNNLYIENGESEEKTITEDENIRVVNGKAVHQNEFGIKKGTFWSPDGNLLAFYRMDETMVTDYPLVNASARSAKLMHKVYPMAGMKSHHVTVGVYDVSAGKTIFLNTGTPKEKYLTNIAWSPDSKYIYIAQLNRGQDTCVVKNYDARTGKLHKELFTETHAKYVEPQDPPLFLKNEPTQFIWMSRRDGYNHAYLYSTNGTMIKQLTKGNWEVASILGLDEKAEHLIYLSNEISPIEKHLFKVNIKTGKYTQLSKEEGKHTAQLSQSGKYVYDRYTSQHNPGKIAFTDVKTNKTRIFHEAKNPYKDITLPQITLGTLKANDGETDLYYRLIKPTNFDATKKYPVIVYVYGGPHSQMVENSWMAAAGGWHIYMAQLGYVVFTLDNRGTAGRGFDFENIIHRNLGIVETQDQLTGVDFLKSQAYVDAQRIGVHGWSYGGFMTMNLMLRHPDIFKVGVAGGPVTDWKYYEIMYGERYMDSPQENPKGYEETSMVDKAGNLQGRLLIIHGDEDPVVVMQHSLQFAKSAVSKGTHPDMFIYPGHEHNVMGIDRVHLHEHITRYFNDFLK